MSFGYSHRFSVDAFGRRIRSSLSGLMEEAARAYHARDLDVAERSCLALLEGDPRHFDALHLQGVICIDRGRLPDAVDYLTRAVRERPDDAQANYHLGTALLGVKLYEQAEQVLRHALALRPDDTATPRSPPARVTTRRSSSSDAFWRLMTGNFRRASTWAVRWRHWTASMRRSPFFARCSLTPPPISTSIG